MTDTRLCQQDPGVEGEGELDLCLRLPAAWCPGKRAKSGALFVQTQAGQESSSYMTLTPYTHCLPTPTLIPLRPHECSGEWGMMGSALPESVGPGSLIPMLQLEHRHAVWRPRIPMQPPSQGNMSGVTSTPVETSANWP